jgi:hypothetical protein
MNATVRPWHGKDANKIRVEDGVDVLRDTIDAAVTSATSVKTSKHAEAILAQPATPKMDRSDEFCWEDVDIVRNGKVERHETQPNAAPRPDRGIQLKHFRAYLEQHNYFFLPTRQPWPASSVNACLPRMPIFDAKGRPVVNKNGEQETIPASTWLDRNARVVQITWVPGEPMLINDRIVASGGWTEHKGVSVLNLYRPPQVKLGDASLAGPWVDHVHKVYPAEADHIINGSRSASNGHK